MKQNEKSSKLLEAVETPHISRAAELLVELLLDDTEGIGDIAADFIENELGRFDWVNNWETIKSSENPLARIAEFLTRYDLVADPQEVFNHIENMAQTNPGRWK